MGKTFRWCKNFEKRIGVRRKLTFSVYKIGVHVEQQMEKRRRKNYLKAKSILSQGKKSVVVGNAIYYWGEDKKSIIALEPDFDGMRRAAEMIKKRETMDEESM